MTLSVSDLRIGEPDGDGHRFYPRFVRVLEETSNSVLDIVMSTLENMHGVGAYGDDRRVTATIQQCIEMWRAPSVSSVLALILTMTTSLPTDSISIFKDGKLKPGVYKIQNIYSETYLDIEVHSRGVRCRPANDLGEGRGFVSWYLAPVTRASNGWKWEIKNFGAGYTIQVVRVPMLFGVISAIAR